MCAICDGNLYKDKNIAVIGGGNSAIEDLTIRIQYTLLPTGHLLVQLKCVETQLVMNVKCDNVELVDYA